MRVALGWVQVVATNSHAATVLYDHDLTGPTVVASGNETVGLSHYFCRTAPPEELTPTLTAGVTFDHISSVGMPFPISAALPVILYSGVFLATATLKAAHSIPGARLLLYTGCRSTLYLSLRITGVTPAGGK